MAMSAKAGSTFRRAYVIALLMIAVCSVASFAVLHLSLRAMSSDSAVLAVSGRQPLLAQRATALISAADTAPSDSDRATAIYELESVAALLASSHTALIDGDPKLGLPGNPSAAVRKLYFGKTRSVDRSVKLFLRCVNKLLAGYRNATFDSDAARFTTMLGNQIVVDGLDAVVAQYEAEARDRVRMSENIHISILAVLLLVLCVAARFIFLPAARQIEQTTSEILKSQAGLDHAATHDSLTDLANRRHCREILDKTIADVDKGGGRALVAHLDLDGFKGVNDTLGHAAGDVVLKEVAERLREAVRDCDTVARIGGDEFMVICPADGRVRDAAGAAGRLMAAFEEPFDPGAGLRVDVGCSIGISEYPGDVSGSDDLLVAADLALYRAKESGKNRWYVFDKSMREEFQHKTELNRRVRAAVDRGEFEVFYQPQVHIESGRVTGVESLLRWRDPVHGLRGPDEFVDLIDRSDSMIKLGAFVMDRAIADAARWHRDGVSFGRVALNISAVQLRDADFIDNVLDRLFTHRLPPEKLAIEIVEGTVVTSHNRRLRATLDELNDLDISVEFDDFGTGYASLTHLRQLPVNRIKIDRSFVMGLPESDDHGSIVRGVIKIAQRLNLAVIAEGVETAEQARIIHRWGCEHAQGFLYAKPAPFDETSAYLQLADYKRIRHLDGTDRPGDACAEPRRGGRMSAASPAPGQ